MLLKYHAAYYRQPDGWIVVSLLDFPGVHSQGKNMREARHMIRDALQIMVETYLDDERPLPKPDRSAKDKEADVHETIALEIRARALARS